MHTQNSHVHDPDRDGTEDPGNTPEERQAVLDRELSVYQAHGRRG